jgi:hypothetical protein
LSFGWQSLKLNEACHALEAPIHADRAHRLVTARRCAITPQPVEALQCKLRCSKRCDDSRHLDGDERDAWQDDMDGDGHPLVLVCNFNY